MELTPLQKKILGGFKKTNLVEKFYLTGGTLLAIRYLQHRHSLDLDFFTNASFSLTEIEPQIIRLANLAQATLQEFRHIADRYEWEIRDATEHTKIEFVFYDFKPLKLHPHWKGIFIDSLEDITANKVAALFERFEPKDIFDLYYILNKTHWRITTILRFMKKKFQLSVTPQIFFSDAERALNRLKEIQGLLLIEEPRNQEELFQTIHNYFDREARRYLNQLWR